MRKKNLTEKSNSFSTIKVLFVSNEIECPVHLQTELDLEQLSDRYLFTLKQTASTATQKQTKKL